MKNPLADVLRQSTDGDVALSDSGSFDTSGAVLGPTANDEQVVSDDAIDLELLEATGAVILDNGTVTFEPGEVAQSGQSDRVEPPATNLTPYYAEKAPLLSRFAPLICTVVGVLAAASWAAYQQLDIAEAASALGAEELVNTTQADPFAGTVHLEGAEQFPFINRPDSESETP